MKNCFVISNYNHGATIGVLLGDIIFSPHSLTPQVMVDACVRALPPGDFNQPYLNITLADLSGVFQALGVGQCLFIPRVCRGSCLQIA